LIISFSPRALFLLYVKAPQKGKALPTQAPALWSFDQVLEYLSSPCCVGAQPSRGQMSLCALPLSSCICLLNIVPCSHLLGPCRSRQEVRFPAASTPFILPLSPARFRVPTSGGSFSGAKQPIGDDNLLSRFFAPSALVWLKSSQFSLDVRFLVEGFTLFLGPLGFSLFCPIHLPRGLPSLRPYQPFPLPGPRSS